MRNLHFCPQSVEELDLLASEPDRGVIETLGHFDGDILVAGAGGKMGFHLSLMLRRALDILGSGRRVFAVSRFGSEESRKPFDDAGIAVLPADLCEPRDLANLPDADTVFFLAGKKFGTAGASDELRRFNEEMPARFAERFASASVVAMSTGCVYPFVGPESGGSREVDPAEPSGDYAISCLGRERAFLEASERYGTQLALVRLNYSVDLRYGVLVDLATRILSGEPVDLTTGYFNCMWQGDAVRHMIRALDLAAPFPQADILNVTGSRVLSVREVAEQLGALLNLVVEFTGEESETAWLNDASRAHGLFGAPKISEDTLIEWVAEWCGHGRPLLGKPTCFEVRDGHF